MYKVPPDLWVSLATVNFDSNVALWLQNYEAQYGVECWSDLCVAVERKFGRDLYHNYMRDLLTIEQTVDVLEYVGRFEQAKQSVSSQ